MNIVALDWQSPGGWLATAVFAAGLSYLASSRVTDLARRSGMIAQPGERQSHDVATPTGGGLGLILSIAVTTLCLQWIVALPGFWWQKIFPGVVALAIVGWFDDKHTVSSLVRLLVQLAVSIWLLGFGLLQFSLPATGLFLFAALAMIWVMNLYNFMDGSNGMAGFQGVFAGSVLAILFQLDGQSGMALVAVSVAAACGGFLPLNFPRARVFMGDVASVPLGFIFAALAVYGLQSGSFSFPVALLIMSVFIVDATLTLLVRVIRGEQWYTAHAQHIYQRLIAHGWSHRRVLVVYQAINAALVLPSLVLAGVYPQYAVSTVLFTFVLLGISWQIANRKLGMLAEVQ